MKKKTGTPFMQTLIETQNNERAYKVKSFLESDYIFETNQGYSIDVLKLVDKLDKENKETLRDYLLKTLTN